MTADFPTIVRFNRALATTLLICGGAIFVSSGLEFLAGRFPFGLIASFAFLVAGVTLRRHSYFRLDRRELIVYKPTGTEDYRCALTSVCDLDIDTDSSEVYLLSSGERRKMPLYRWLAEDEDWAKFERVVASRDQAVPEVDGAADGAADGAMDGEGTDAEGKVMKGVMEGVMDTSTPASLGVIDGD